MHRKQVHITADIGPNSSNGWCPGLTCGANIVKPRLLFKTVDLWSYILILPTDRYSHMLANLELDYLVEGLLTF